MIRKRIASFGSALVLSLSSLLIFSAPRVLAATATWDGGGSDSNATTAANWAGDIAPVAGDDLVFPANVTNRTVNNDFTAATSFNSITFSGTATAASNYDLSGNAMEVVAGISSIMTGDYSTGHFIDLPLTLTSPQSISTTSANGSETYLTFDNTINIGSNSVTIDAGKPISINGAINGSGGLAIAGVQSVFLSGNNSSYSGAITVTAQALYVGDVNALGTSGTGTTVSDGSQLIFDLIDINQQTFTIAEPLTLAGDGDGLIWTDYALGVIGCGGPSCIDNADVTLSGPITLTANTQFATHSKVTLTGPISGTYTMAMAKTYPGKFVVSSSSNTSSTPNGTLTAPAYTTTYSDEQPSVPVTVNYNETAVITGKRQSVFVDSGGILKGTGTVGTLEISNGGKVAPGLSPGCLNSGDLTFVSGSTYDFEVGGTTVCTQYDQIKVTGTVTLGSGTLNTLIINGFTPAAGNSFTIIDNDSNDAVSGTFSNLAEGATFTLNGAVFKVSYVGGDGNDVVLSVQSVPTTPVTGSGLIKANPLQSFLALSSLAGAIALIARRNKKYQVR